MSDFSFISNAHPSYIESMYAQYEKDPEQVEGSWRSFFKGFDYALGSNGNGHAAGTATAPTAFDSREFQVYSLILAFRNRGHLLSTTNPLRERRDRRPHLNLEDFALSEADMDLPFQVSREIGLENATLRDIIAHMRKVYCGNIGFEYHHIEKRDRRRWIRTRIERLEHHPDNAYNFNLDKKRRILQKLNGAVGFEEFLGVKFVGQKRFSLEGGETTIVALDGIINAAAASGVEEVVIGMAHRGRLNVLANIMGKTYAQIFNEFEGNTIPDLSFGDGDVKYHLGFSSQVTTPDDKTIHLKLVPNPSHLEAVNPVVEGFSRAKADILYHNNYKKILPILIHGDAAVAGQGVGYETVQMSQLDGYHTGGTLHFVINNQVGFTTDFDDARSSTYCTAIAAAVHAPVFHVNGEDPEAVLFAVEMAVAYRQAFHTDVFIDMVCYRKHGHNEGDDPQFTQPEMYRFIKGRKNPREIYTEMLIARGDLEASMAAEMEEDFKDFLQSRLDEVRQNKLSYVYQEPEQAWRQLRRTIDPKDFEVSPETGIAPESVEKILAHLMSMPEGFNPISKVDRLLKGTQKLIDNNQLDWAMGELLAYGSILLEGKDVRMSGQDVKRGTFSHRHSVLRDEDTNKEYVRLSGMSPDQGQFRIYNSLLSEFAVLGFEYGYSLASPDPLVIWEAQFGDFSNGAQTIIDQFISSSESKWQRMSGLCLLLPHGYEGQGPEHSSARLERFLMLGAHYNITVANVTSPANFFHLMRRQLARPFRKPLVLMSPKSLLRHPEVVSPTEAFTTGTRFEEVIDDASVGKGAKKVTRVLLCSGKMYFDLIARKREGKRDDVAVVRVEQLYPLPVKQLSAILEKYASAAFYWVQEEPRNMGPWFYMDDAFRHGGFTDKQLTPVCRPASPSPATGYKKVHDAQQVALVDAAFAK